MSDTDDHAPFNEELRRAMGKAPPPPEEPPTDPPEPKHRGVDGGAGTNARPNRAPRPTVNELLRDEMRRALGKERL